MIAWVAQVGLVFRRQVRAALADPGPSFILPMMPSLLMLIVFTSVFDSLSQVRGFATAGFSATTWDAFVAPGTVVMVALLGGGYTSASLAFDLRCGYAQRMTLAGAGSGPLLAGRLLFEALRLFPGAALVLLVGFPLGAEPDNGMTGIAVLLALVALLGVAFSGVFYVIAIATEDPQTPFTLQPVGLPLAFLSSTLVPVGVMPGWSEAVARINPVTVVANAAREAMIGDLWSNELLVAGLVLGAWIALSELAAWRLLRTKLLKG